MSRNTPWRTARRMYALHQPSRNDWYRIKNQAGGPTQLHIYDEIGYFGVSANDLVRDLADVTGDLEVHINSPGGDVWDGIAIYNALLARNNVSIHIDGIAASIASVIAMAGNPVLIARNAQMMIHEGFAMGIGNAQDMRDLAEQLDKASNNIASIYSDHTGKPIAYWREVMKAETWYDADEAVEAGLADRLIESGAGRRVAQVTDKWDLSVFGATGRQTDAGTRPVAVLPWDPDGDGDDDSNAKGDTDHSHWTKKGRQIQPVPGFPMRDAASGELVYAWDAAAALAKCHSASDFRSVCAGEHNSGDPDSQSHWALPHHNSPGSGPDKGGVVAALGRWNQTEDLKNKDAALSHLRSHARDLGLPSGDDDKKSGNKLSAEFGDLDDDTITQWASALKL